MRGQKSLTKADFRMVEKDVDAFLDSGTVVRQCGVKGHVFPPTLVQGTFNSKQRATMQGFYDDFNKNIYPPIRDGIKAQKRELVIKGLVNWEKNNRSYKDFMLARIKDVNLIAGDIIPGGAQQRLPASIADKR